MLLHAQQTTLSFMVPAELQCCSHMSVRHCCCPARQLKNACMASLCPAVLQATLCTRLCNSFAMLVLILGSTFLTGVSRSSAQDPRLASTNASSTDVHAAICGPCLQGVQSLHQAGYSHGCLHINSMLITPGVTAADTGCYLADFPACCPALTGNSSSY